MVIEQATVPTFRLESVAATWKVYVPGVVGVPVMFPAVSIERPKGS
jgi:hypothetical protein